MTVLFGVALLCGVFVSLAATIPSKPLRSINPLYNQKRIYTTNALEGFTKDNPRLWPPGYGGDGAIERVVVDVGANNGDFVTLQGFKKGHHVFAFEPSPKVNLLFREVMRSNQVDVALIKLKEQNDKGPFKARKLSIPFGNKEVSPKVYLLPLALSNITGEARFHQSPCQDLSKCGKLNHLSRRFNRKDVMVQTFKFDDIVLPIEPKKIWYMKIDVEGHELEVLQGSRKTLKKVKVPYISLEFSSNGRRGIEWGVQLLEELHNLGYVCYHLRGFGKCHDASFRSPSLKCNYPFNTTDLKNAPTFQEYSEVFEVIPGREKKRLSMSDIMCAHKSVI